MAAVPVFDVNGERTGEVEIDPALLGGRVRTALLKQAIVAHLDHQRQRSARTRSRGMVVGSTRKIYRQKGTGRARMGTLRTVIRRGGGVAFAKQAPFGRKTLPRKMRTLARNSAVLAKIQSQDALIIDGLELDAPKTRVMAKLLAGVGASRGCVFATRGPDANVYLSGRNLPKTEIRAVEQLNAYEVLRRPKLVFTKPAFEAFCQMAEAGRSGSRNRQG